MAYLTVENLNKSIDNIHLLKDISFSAEKATITLIAGKNGSGKSLLLKCLKGLERIDSGRIIVDGKELKKEKERMKFFGLVFQETSLQIVGQTCEKDIAFGLENQNKPEKEIKEKTEEMLSLFSLQKDRNKNPRILSGGEKRRLAIAGVIAMESKIILLDEPLANLDYPSVLVVLQTILKLKEEGYTLLIVSHEAEKFLALTDYTIIINNGEIINKGSSREMVEPLRDNMIYLPPLSFEDFSWLK